MILAVVALTLAAAPVDQVAVAQRKVLAADGAALAVYRYRLEGADSALPPVVLLPDLAMGRAVFDFEGFGLARFLAARGRTVFVVEPRGQGKAAAPLRDDALLTAFTHDLPLLLDAVSPKAQVDLVVQGWGGALALATTPVELKGRVRKIVAFNTPAFAEEPSRMAMVLLREGGKLGSLGLDPEGARIFELLFASGRMSPAKLAGLRSAAFSNLGKTRAKELLAWISGGPLTFPDGSTFDQRLAQFDVPTFLMVALGDGWANAELCSPLREFPKAKVTLRLLSKVELGEDYSHLSVLQGDRAPKDVFVPLAKFLEAP